MCERMRCCSPNHEALKLENPIDWIIGKAKLETSILQHRSLLE